MKKRKRNQYEKLQNTQQYCRVAGHKFIKLPLKRKHTKKKDKKSCDYSRVGAKTLFLSGSFLNYRVRTLPEGSEAVVELSV